MTLITYHGHQLTAINFFSFSASQKSPTTSSPSQVSLYPLYQNSTANHTSQDPTTLPSNKLHHSTSQNTMTNTNNSQRAALQAITSLQQKSTNISSTFANYAKHQTAGQVLNGLETPEQIQTIKQELVEDSFEIEALLHSCTGLGGEIDIISQSYKSSLVEIERLKQELARKNAVIEERDATHRDIGSRYQSQERQNPRARRLTLRYRWQLPCIQNMSNSKNSIIHPSNAINKFTSIPATPKLP
jgi:hypothetical protein